jgi:hypothetical protein
MNNDSIAENPLEKIVECPKCHRPCAMWEIIEYEMCEFCYEYGTEAQREHEWYYDEDWDEY